MPPKGGRLRLPLQASVPASSALQGLSGPQVFGKGNTAFWVIFSVIHILSTLLLSTQLYYMGRWKLGEWVQHWLFLAAAITFKNEAKGFLESTKLFSSVTPESLIRRSSRNETRVILVE